MEVIGFSPEEISVTFRVISAILWLGNVSFVEDAQESSSVADANGDLSL